MGAGSYENVGTQASSHAKSSVCQDHPIKERRSKTEGEETFLAKFGQAPFSKGGRGGSGGGRRRHPDVSPIPKQGGRKRRLQEEEGGIYEARWIEGEEETHPTRAVAFLVLLLGYSRRRPPCKREGKTGLELDHSSPPAKSI